MSTQRRNAKDELMRLRAGAVRVTREKAAGAVVDEWTQIESAITV